MVSIITLGSKLTLENFIQVVRYHVPVDFSRNYKNRVKRSRELVEQWIREERPMYGTTTGLGVLCDRTISSQEAEILQRNILLSHSVSVGAPLSEDSVRAIMLMCLQNLGQGYSGVRLEVLEMYREFLNRNLIPWVPGHGSVGYLGPEAHMALVMIGEGRAWFQGELLSGKEALARAGLSPITLAAKEGLALVSGTTSATAMAALAVYDMVQSAKSADIISALSLENAGGQMAAFDSRVMAIRPHPTQGGTAENIRRILQDSAMIEANEGVRIQDALSLRCIPQLHGAVKKTLYDAIETIEIEMNSCCDNPIIWPQKGYETVISACNADSAYVGLEMDSCCIAATSLAKMSERRNNRLIDGTAGYPAFMISNPGLNSGLMIPQYTQAGLINEMRVMSNPASSDNTPTCATQEDYVAMGYYACRKAVKISHKLEYVLAIELLTDYMAQRFIPKDTPVSPVSQLIYERIAEDIPMMENDEYLYPYIEFLRNLIHNGELLRIVEDEIGDLK